MEWPSAIVAHAPTTKQTQRPPLPGAVPGTLGAWSPAENLGRLQRWSGMPGDGRCLLLMSGLHQTPWCHSQRLQDFEKDHSSEAACLPKARDFSTTRLQSCASCNRCETKLPVLPQNLHIFHAGFSALAESLGFSWRFQGRAAWFRCKKFVATFRSFHWSSNIQYKPDKPVEHNSAKSITIFKQNLAARRLLSPTSAIYSLSILWSSQFFQEKSIDFSALPAVSHQPFHAFLQPFAGLGAAGLDLPHAIPDGIQLQRRRDVLRARGAHEVLGAGTQRPKRWELDSGPVAQYIVGSVGQRMFQFMTWFIICLKIIVNQISYDRTLANQADLWSHEYDLSCQCWMAKLRMAHWFNSWLVECYSLLAINVAWLN